MLPDTPTRAGHVNHTFSASQERTVEQDDLDHRFTPGDPAGREPVVMLIRDVTVAESCGNTRGVEVFGGPRAGPQTVEAVECEGRVEPVTITDGNVVAIGPPQRQIPKRLRRAVLARDRKCVIDSCRSSYRLQTHHVIPRRDGGDSSAANLATLCWYHHHIAIHRKGHRIDPDTPPHRRRLLPRRTWTGYRHPTNVEYLNPVQQQERAYQTFLDKYHLPTTPPRRIDPTHSPAVSGTSSRESSSSKSHRSSNGVSDGISNPGRQPNYVF